MYNFNDFRKGNKASVWEMMIKEKKLPYMAMVRNIRNMIMAGISDEVVKLAVKYLTNEKAVIRSRMFPYRFYTAYDILDEIKDFKAKTFLVYGTKKGKKPTEEELKKVEGLEKKFDELKRKQKKINENAIEEFKKALDKAVEIATNQNIPPIKGITIILLQLTNESAARTKVVTDILFALMLLRSCENSTLFVAHSCKCTTGNYKEVTVKMDESSLLSLVKEFQNAVDIQFDFFDHTCSGCQIISHDHMSLPKMTNQNIALSRNSFYSIDLIR